MHVRVRTPDSSAASDQLTTCPIFLSVGTLNYWCFACDEMLPPSMVQCSGGWHCPAKAIHDGSKRWTNSPRRRLPSPRHAAERQSSGRTTKRDPVTFIKGQLSAAGCIRSARRIKADTFLAPRRHGGGRYCECPHAESIELARGETGLFATTTGVFAAT